MYVGDAYFATLRAHFAIQSMISVPKFPGLVVGIMIGIELKLAFPNFRDRNPVSTLVWCTVLAFTFTMRVAVCL